MEEQIEIVAENDNLDKEEKEKVEEVTEKLELNIEESTGIKAIIEEIYAYTDAQMLISMYSWEEGDVIDGESVGVCHKPSKNADALLSCWEWKKNEEGVFLEDPSSYLFDGTALTEDSTLGDFPAVDNVLVPAMFGNWLCATPFMINKKMRATCARLVPKEDKIEDPTYNIGDEITVMTYFSSRHSGRIQSPEPLNGNDGFFVNNSAFEQFQFDIQDTIDYVLNSSFNSLTQVFGAIAAVVAISF